MPKTRIRLIKETKKYPCVRILKEDFEAGIANPLVVLFTSRSRGIPLSRTHQDIGRREQWIEADDLNTWLPVSLYIQHKTKD